VPTLDFDTKLKEISVVIKEYGETDTELNTSKSLKNLADKIINDEPLFQFFLDGSRRTYKVDDIEINRNVFPIIAGQIGVACCQRKSPDNFKCVEFENKLVLTLPRSANPNATEAKLFFNNLKDKVYNNEIEDKVPDYDSTERYPRSVLKFSTDKQKSSVHPTQKPVELMKYLIKTYTNKGETVLDFTMGSGTTGVAVEELNRDGDYNLSFYGIELDEGYFNIAKERIEKV
jgi:hypothetical protein